MPLYVLGMMGATRRLYHYEDPSWQWLFIVAGIGVCIIVLGVVFQLLQLAVSIRDRKKNKAWNDPWYGRTLEWSIPSPAPFYNFAHLPEVYGRDPWWVQKHGGVAPQHGRYTDIVMPKNTGVGVVLGACAVLFGFGIVWHMWWLALISFGGILTTLIARAMVEHTEYVVSAEQVEQIENRFKHV
jgi:cytochrome o ubiquinol oxidase subunit 1